jgi:hypothetical protein
MAKQEPPANMYVASKSTVRWFLALSAVFLMLGFFLKTHIPERIICNVNDIFLASVFALIGVLCVLVGAAGPWSLRRDEHPISFWSMVGVTWSLSVFFILCGLGVFHQVCGT